MVPFNYENFIDAYFLNPERSDVKVLYKDVDKTISHIIQVDSDSEEFIKLLEIVSIDDIIKNTDEYNNGQQKAIQNFYLSLLDSGKVNVVNTVVDEENFVEKIVDFILRYDGTNEKQVEDFFKLKLEVFDLETVQNLPSEIKESLRQSNSPLELFTILKTSEVVY